MRVERGVAVHAVPTITVIIRLVRSCALGRMIQYSRDVRDQPRGRGVLDRPVKPGDDGGVFGLYYQPRTIVALDRERHHLAWRFA